MPLTRKDPKILVLTHTDTVRFFLHDREKQITCRVSFEAMDDMERALNTFLRDRVAQFARLRDAIEKIAQRRYHAGLLLQDGTVLITSKDV